MRLVSQCPTLWPWRQHAPDGSPSVRMVMLRELEPEPLFVTDCESEKGVDLAHTAQTAAVFHWLLPINRQVRIMGLTSRISDAKPIGIGSLVHRVHVPRLQLLIRVG